MQKKMMQWAIAAILTICGASVFTACTSNDDNPTHKPEPRPVVWEKGVLPGRFTVNAEGLQVQFAQGNLQYQASSNTWRFAEHQYDIVGDATIGNVYENGVKSDNTAISSDYDVMLFHDTKDDVVPVENFYAMSKFLKNHGIKTEEFVGEYSSETIKELGVTNHETSALTFFLRIIEWVTANY